MCFTFPLSLSPSKFISLFSNYTLLLFLSLPIFTPLFPFSRFYPTFFLTNFHFHIYSTFSHSFSLSQLCKLLLFFLVEGQWWVLILCYWCCSWWTSLLLLVLECFNFPFPKYFKTLLRFSRLVFFNSKMRLHLFYVFFWVNGCVHYALIYYLLLFCFLCAFLWLHLLRTIKNVCDPIK